MKLEFQACKHGHQTVYRDAKGILRCKECNRARCKKYAVEHRVQRREYSHKYYSNHRSKLISLQVERTRRLDKKRRANIIEILGGKCVKCSFDDIRALQIDHINGGGSRETRSLSQGGFYKKLLSMSRSDLFKHVQLLCANCNWIKRHENDENYVVKE